MIVSPEHRSGTLLAAGVPGPFLRALDELEAFQDLQFLIKPPDAAYFYLPNLAAQVESLSDCEITPVCDGINGDIFYVHLASASHSRFARLDLESEEIGEDFGPAPAVLLANLFIECYEFSELPPSELVEIWRKLGFAQAAEVCSALELASSCGERSTFKADQEWRSNQLHSILESK